MNISSPYFSPCSRVLFHVWGPLIQLLQYSYVCEPYVQWSLTALRNEYAPTGQCVEGHLCFHGFPAHVFYIYYTPKEFICFPISYTRLLG